MDARTAYDFAWIAVPALLYFGALWMMARAWAFYDRADALLYEQTRLMVEARRAMPRDHRGRFLPRRHLGEDAIGAGDFVEID